MFRILGIQGGFRLWPNGAPSIFYRNFSTGKTIQDIVNEALASSSSLEEFQSKIRDPFERSWKALVNPFESYSRITYKNYKVEQNLSSSSSFEDFKLKMDEFFQEYCESSVVKLICGDDPEKLQDGFTSYCRTQYNKYHTEGNPALMIGPFDDEILTQEEYQAAHCLSFEDFSKRYAQLNMKDGLSDEEAYQNMVEGMYRDYLYKKKNIDPGRIC